MRHSTLGDTLYFWFAVNSTAGEATDATGTPTFDVRKGGAAANAAPTIEGSATLIEHANYPAGAYEVSIAATGGNGFEADAEYGVFCQAAVSSVNPIGYVGGFRLAPVPADAKKLGGTTQTGHDVGGTVATNLNATVSSRATQTSLDTLAGYVDTEMAAVLAAVDTEVAAIKAKTDPLTFTGGAYVQADVTYWKASAAPDNTGDAYARLGAPAGVSVSADVAGVLSAVQAITASFIRSAIGMSAANLDTQLAAISTLIDTEVAAILAAVDTEVAAIKAKTDSLTFTSAGKVDASLQAAGDVVAAVCNKIADHMRRRTQANVAASSDGDALSLLSLYGMIQQLQKSGPISGGSLPVKNPDGSALGTLTISSDANASPVTGVTP